MREEKEGVKKKKKKPTHLTQTVGQRKGEEQEENCPERVENQSKRKGGEV